jgi:hypothetical protein
MELRAKKRQRCQTHETERAGEMWDHTAVTADSKLVVSLVGKRTQEQTHAVVYDAKRQTPPTPCLPQCARKPTVLDWRKAFDINNWPLT